MVRLVKKTQDKLSDTRQLIPLGSSICTLSFWLTNHLFLLLACIYTFAVVNDHRKIRVFCFPVFAFALGYPYIFKFNNNVVILGKDQPTLLITVYHWPSA